MDMLKVKLSLGLQRQNLIAYYVRDKALHLAERFRA
jgi:hypothetical protein